MAFYCGLGTTTGEECYDESGVYIGCPWDTPRSGQPVLTPILTQPTTTTTPAPPPPTSSPVPTSPSTPVLPPPAPPPPAVTAPVPTATTPTPTLPDHLYSTDPVTPIFAPSIFAPPPVETNVSISRSTGGDALSQPAEPGVGKVVFYGAIGIAAIWLLRR